MLPVRVYWQPGCSSCLKTKELLEHHGVAFESMNVLGSPAALDALRALGARGVPVVARGDRYTYAQSPVDVLAFLGLDARVAPRLSPAMLAARLHTVLETGTRVAAQVPAARLDDRTPGRPRSLRMLVHHVFRIGEVLLINARTRRLTMEMVVVEPPASMTLDALLDYGRDVTGRVGAWRARIDDVDIDAPVETFYGVKPLHELLERTAWHAAQHVRQLETMLCGMGIEPDGPLSADTLAGLPVPQDIWDE